MDSFKVVCTVLVTVDYDFFGGSSRDPTFRPDPRYYRLWYIDSWRQSTCIRVQLARLWKSFPEKCINLANLVYLWTCWVLDSCLILKENFNRLVLQLNFVNNNTSRIQQGTFHWSCFVNIIVTFLLLKGCLQKKDLWYTVSCSL